MASFSENFRNGDVTKPCRMCSLFPDLQSHSVNCNETMKTIRGKGKYEEIFSKNISRETALMVTQILEVRKNKLD